jgi:hypothetical protein
VTALSEVQLLLTVQKAVPQLAKANEGRTPPRTPLHAASAMIFDAFNFNSDVILAAPRFLGDGDCLPTGEAAY